MTSNYASELKCFSVCVGSQFSHLTVFTYYVIPEESSVHLCPSVFIITH